MSTRQSPASSEPDPEFEFGSNPLKLDLRDWIVVSTVVMLGAWLAPFLFAQFEHFEPMSDYRLHHAQSNDYWSLAQWTKVAMSEPEHIPVLGDSAIWGHYVDNTQTLTAELNRRDLGWRFENLGISGMHATALFGMVKHYGTPLNGRRVVLQFAPLWTTSLNADLQDKKEARFQHPRLCPQFFDAPRCYKASIEERLGVEAQRHVPLLLLSEHVMNHYLENHSLAEWTLDHPYENPFAEFRMEIPGDQSPGQAHALSWKAKGMANQNFEWVMPSESYQWEHFKKTVRLLHSRGCRIFVLLGPFNPHILTDASRARFRALQVEINAWLELNHVAYTWAAELPPDLYGDASHPLASGYEIIARDLLQTPGFVRWLESKDVPGTVANR